MDMAPYKRAFVRAARALYKRGLVYGSSGNLSFKVGNRLLISCSGSSFRYLHPSQVVELMICGDEAIASEQKLRPSSELPMHMAILKATGLLHQDTAAVCHTHGVHTIATSILIGPSNSGLPPLTPGLIVSAYPVVVLGQFLPGSRELARAVEEKVLETKARAIILQNHGLICAGSSLEEVLNITEEVEEACRLYLLVRERPEGMSKELTRLILEAYKKACP